MANDQDHPARRLGKSHFGAMAAAAAARAGKRVAFMSRDPKTGEVRTLLILPFRKAPARPKIHT